VGGVERLLRLRECDGHVWFFRMSSCLVQKFR
jgi:hypothetical protein